MVKLRLKELRLAAGLTQADLAEKINVKQASISLWESGENVPTTDKLPALAEIFGVSISELFIEENEE